MAYKDGKLYAPYGGGKTYYYTASITATQQTIKESNVASNKSAMKLTGKLTAGNIAYSGSSAHTLSIYWYDNNKHVTGTLVKTITLTALAIGATATVEDTIDVEHKADGTLKGYGVVAFNKAGTNSYAPDSGSVQLEEFSLSTIPRATKLTAQTLTINTASTITWTKASSDFRHTLTYEFGSLTGTIGTAKGLVDNVSWTPPNSFYQQMAKKSGTGKLYLTTYKGDTKIGDTQEAELTINAKESEAKAVIEEFSIRDENSTTKALTGDNSVLVLGRSTAFVTLVFTAKKWATVNSVVINGKTVSVSGGTTDSNGNTSYSATTSLGTATSGSFTVTITDSRTFPTTKTTTNDIINYISLGVVPNFKRIAPTTGQVGLQFDGNYFNGSFGDTNNSLTISYKYKKSNETTYTSVSLTKDTHYKISGNKYYSGTGSAKSVITLAPTFDYKTQYDMQLLVSDKLTSLTINAQVVKGIPIIWWNSSKFVVNGALNVANSEGAVKTTISDGNISTTGTLSANGKRADILLQNRFTSRPTNANIGTDASGGLCKFLSTGSMTSNKPSNDGHIMHMYWDTDAGWDSQLFVGNGSDPRMRIRGQNAGTWGSWKDVAMASDLTSTVTKCTLANVNVTTGASATVLTQTISTAGTYLLMGYSNLNRYNQNGRELHVKLQKNGTDFWDYLDVGDYGWTVAVTISAVQTFAKNDVLKVVITNPGGKQWAHGVSYLWLVRLPG